MPIANHPQQTTPAWLEIDADLPMATRPVFLCRFLTKFEIDTLTAEYEAIRQMADYEAAHAKLNQFLARGVVGWERQVQPGVGSLDFAADRFDHVLTPPEKFELAQLMLHRPRLTELDLKKSRSLATAPPDSSVPDASEGSAPKISAASHSNAEA